MSDTLLIIFLAIIALIVVIVLLRTWGSKDRPAETAEDQHHGVSDSLAAAVEDVVGEFTGVEANPDFPGDSDVGRPSHDGSGGGASTARGGAGDTLTQIKGLGSKAEAKLKGFGVARFEQIASWTPDDIAMIDSKLGLGARIERDRWVEQAGFLARGEIAAFEEKFGKLG
ncbi:hypothetical protein HFP57_11065 [Parasphingopyxis algicola]|uniref:hypothetical protein n=1 Tax=Parasphingopyxis algicola TaxID=2026624 RepID=UPI0015A0177D|nr:hypothetical protein [Parasphingopyxis algicola]QLC25505.1 hypothetical protein HFP57_11065 [Parasphingopyxis algicola]